MPNNALQSLISRNRSIFFQRAEMFDVTRPWYVDATDMSLNAGGGAFKASQNGLFITDNTSAPVFTAIAVNGTYYNSEAMTIGDVMMGDNGSGKANVLFDQSAGKLYFRKATTAVLSIGTGDDGEAQIDGKLNIASGGGIYQGSSGSFSSPTTGLKIFRSSNNGVMTLYNSGSATLTLSPTVGITIQGSTSFATANAVNFIGASSRRMGAVYGYTDNATYNATRLEAYSDNSTYDPVAYVFSATETTDGAASAYLYSCKFVSPNDIYLPKAIVAATADLNLDKAQAELYAESNDDSAYLLVTADDAVTQIDYIADNHVFTGSKTGFVIDHPLDVENQWLQHSPVEGDRFIVMYDGQVACNAQGEATVQMPDWYAPLVKDVHVQLTCVGAHAPMYVAEIRPRGFKLAGGTNGLLVNWLITATRDDPWAQRRPVIVEKPKTDDEKGYVFAWREYDMPKEKSLRRHKGELDEARRQKPRPDPTPDEPIDGQQPIEVKP